MGCCGLESGDARLAIPVRKLIFRTVQPLLVSLDAGGFSMAGVKRSRGRGKLSAVHPTAAAIDIGATLHVAAVGPDRDPEPVRTFGTFTGDLHRLADWFESCGIRTIAMESTGVYWIPAYEILEQRGFEVLLVNARDAKHVPGRKTDVSDAQWLQQIGRA